MKKFLFMFGILMLGVSVVQAQESDKNYLVKVESENFRASPNGEILGKLNSGTELKVLKQEGNWVKVRVEGYIWKPSITDDPTEIAGFKMHAMHILLETKEKAQEVLAKLKGGADFKELAVKYSKDPKAKRNKGDLGYFKRGDLLKEFEQAVLELEPGETSGIVKTPLGYHIIRRLK